VKQPVEHTKDQQGEIHLNSKKKQPNEQQGQTK
jgi:hypothetical protein